MLGLVLGGTEEVTFRKKSKEEERGEKKASLEERFNNLRLFTLK